MRDTGERAAPVVRPSIRLRPVAASSKTCDNEERFLLSGAAHEGCHEHTEVGAAPVSKKRIGLNRAVRSPMGFAS
jgi:hypothetical protein